MKEENKKDRTWIRMMKIDSNNEWQARKLLVNFFYILHDVSPFDCVFFFTLIAHSSFGKCRTKPFTNKLFKNTNSNRSFLEETILIKFFYFGDWPSPTSCPSFFVLYLCIHFFSYGCQSSIKLFFVTLQDVNNTNVKTWLIWTIPTNTNERTLKGSIGTVSKKDLVDNGDIRLDNLMMTSAKTVKLYK